MPIDAEGSDMDEGEDLCVDCGGTYPCECTAAENCGRWSNGKLMKSCTKAGSEECDFECPLRN
jgi:hypothetical protein